MEHCHYGEGSFLFTIDHDLITIVLTILVLELLNKANIGIAEDFVQILSNLKTLSLHKFELIYEYFRDIHKLQPLLCSEEVISSPKS